MAKGFSSERRGQIAPVAPRFTADATVVGAILVGALYAGREVFVPVVLSVLLSFVLAGPARLLGRLGLGRTPAVALVVALAFATIGGTAAVVTSQLTGLAGDLPRYQSTIRDKLASVRGAATGSGPLERLATMVQDLAGEMTGAGGPAASTLPATLGPEPAGGRAPAREPVPVEIRERASGTLGTVASLVAPLLHPLATTGIVAIFVVFILLQQGDLRNRLIRLAGSHDLQRTTAAMNDAARRLSRYFLTQVLLNAAFGIVVGTALWIIGVPSPVLWGIMAGISRFIPYVGVLLAAGGPLVVAAAVDPGWTMLAWTGLLFVAIEFAVGQVVEPLLYGHSTGITPVAVILSVTFWTWLWGPVGLLIATPLTVCLVVLGRHVEALTFLDVMFGDRPPLTLAEGFYQRMLAGDPGEAYESAEDFLKTHPLVSYYDEVALKGLTLAAADASRGALEDERLERVERAVSTLLDDLADQEDAVPGEATARPATRRAEGDSELDASLEKADAQSAAFAAVSPAEFQPAWRTGTPVLCLAGRDGLDRAGAAMLGQILGRHGIAAAVAGPDELTARPGDPALWAGRTVVVLSVLDASAPARVRYAVRRARRSAPDATVVVGAWNADEHEAAALCSAARADHCVGRIGDAARLCLSLAVGHPVAQSRPADARP